MPTKYTFLAYMFLAILLEGCTSKQNNKIPILYLENIYSEKENLLIDNIGTDIQQITLQTTNDILIGGIYNIHLFPEFMVITHDNKYSIFDREGSYISQIGNYGNGPSEYRDFDCSIVLYEDTLYLYDKRLLKLLAYSRNGEFITSYPVKKRLIQMIHFNENVFVGFIEECHIIKEPMLYFFNSEGIPVDSIFPTLFINHTYSVFSLNSGNELYKYKNDVRFKEIYNDTVFTITKELTLEPQYIFDPGKYSFKLEEYLELLYPKNINYLDSKRMPSVRYENDRYLILLDGYERYYYILWDKKSEQMKRVKFRYNEQMKNEFVQEDIYVNVNGQQLNLNPDPDKNVFIPRFISKDNQYLITYEHSINNPEDNPVIVLVKVTDKVK